MTREESFVLTTFLIRCKEKTKLIMTTYFFSASGLHYQNHYILKDNIIL